MRNSIRLGDRVVDTLTGFRGIVAGIVDYISGCHQCLVAPACKEDGDMRPAEWIDTVRLERSGEEPFALPLAETQGPGRTPVRDHPPRR